MHSLLELLYGPARVFLGHPELAYFVAVGFLALLVVSALLERGLRLGTQAGLALTAVLWVAFGLNEQRMAGTGANIRVDLLFAWPPLAFISLVTAIGGLLSITAASPRPDITNHEPRTARTRRHPVRQHRAQDW